MKIIEDVISDIEDELDDAEKYATKALHKKDSYPHLAQTYAMLSQEEMKHMGALHDEIVMLISDYKKEHGEPPVPMQAVYDYLHGKYIERAADIRVLQNMFVS